MEQTKNKGVSLRGIERNTNDINTQDGACDELINLRIKDGAIRPVGEKERDTKDFLAFSGYENFTNIFKHGILPEGLFVALYSDSNGQSIVLINTSFGINPDTFLAEASEATTELVITASMDGAFTITTDSPSWITLSKASGTGNDTVTVTVDPSDTADRSGTITFTGTNGTYVCTITQEGLILTVDDETISTDYEAKTVDITVTSILPEDETFSAEELSAYDWITDISITDDVITVTLAENNSGGQRNGTIRVYLDNFLTIYKDVVITQELMYSVTANPDTLSFIQEGESKTTNVTMVTDDVPSVVCFEDTGVELIVADWISTEYEPTTDVLTITCDPFIDGLAPRLGQVKLMHPERIQSFEIVYITQRHVAE